MSHISFKQGDSIEIIVGLPRDLNTVSSVDLIVGKEDPTSITATIRDPEENLAVVRADDITKGVGQYMIEWKLTFDDGLVETIPTEGFDYMEIEPSLV